MTHSKPATVDDAAATGRADLWDFHRPVARRSLILCAAGALLGLAIAGVGLFTAQGTRTATVPAEDAATVNGVPILRADLVQQVASLYAIDYGRSTPEQRRKVLGDMIREELYVQRGIEIGLPNDDIDVRSALVAATEGQVAQDAMTSKPSERELETWYDGHVADYASEGLMTVHEWLLPTGATDAQPVADRLRRGEPASALGLKSSGRVDDGEEYYFAARVHLGDRIFDVARMLKDGEVSRPLPSKDGVRILQMVRNVVPVPTPFQEVKSRVLHDVLEDKAARLQEANGRFLRKRADVKYAPDFQ
ncbi:MAG TPA: peptidyl-prolyl cis-trans isomerase [Burkholderiaceae bacterium]